MVSFPNNLKPEKILELEQAALTCQIQRKRSDDNHGKDVEEWLEQLWVIHICQIFKSSTFCETCVCIENLERIFFYFFPNNVLTSATDGTARIFTTTLNRGAVARKMAVSWFEPTVELHRLVGHLKDALPTELQIRGVYLET